MYIIFGLLITVAEDIFDKSIEFEEVLFALGAILTLMEELRLLRKQKHPKDTALN